MKKGKMILLTISLVFALILIIFQIISMRNVELNHSIEVKAPKEKVWQILTELETVAYYNPKVKAAVCISTSRTGIGASRECTMHDGSKVKERIIKLETDPYAVSMELYESSWPVKDMNWRTVLESKGNKTLINQNLQYKVKFGAFGAILNTLMMKGKMESAIQETFEGLKDYSERKDHGK